MIRKKQLRTKGVAGPMDKFIGAKIRRARELKGFSQERLASALEITFQQIQKYESGANRVSASRLAGISQILSLPIYVFFPPEFSVETTGEKPCSKSETK